MLEDPGVHARRLSPRWLAAACLIAVAALPFRVTARTAVHVFPEKGIASEHTATNETALPGQSQSSTDSSDAQDRGLSTLEERLRLKQIELQRAAETRALERREIAARLAAQNAAAAIDRDVQASAPRQDPDNAARHLENIQDGTLQFLRAQLEEVEKRLEQGRARLLEAEKHLEQARRDAGLSELERSYQLLQAKYGELLAAREDARRLQASASSASRSIAQDGSVKPPVKIKHVDPFYPPAAKEQSISGPVAIRLEVGADGVVQEPNVVSGAHALLIQAARDAVRQWRFGPMLVGGQPTPFSYNVLIVFRLSTQPAPSSAEMIELSRLTFLGQEPADRGEMLTVTGR